MRTKLHLCLLLTGLAMSAGDAVASGTIGLHGVTYQVDTLFHNQVGPGTTQTSLLLTADGAAPVRVFYSEIDLTNPLVTIRGVSGHDKLAGGETVRSMATRKSHDGAQYFLGINADFYETAGTTARGVSTVGSPVGPTVVDGEILRARSSVASYKSFVVAADGTLHTNPFAFGGTLTAPGGATAPLGGVNINAQSNAVTIYNGFYYGSTNQTSAGWEVEARLADGETFKTAAPFKMIVTGAPSDAGDMTIGEQRYVLRGNGTAAALIQALQAGDEITVSPSWTCGGLQVDPYQMVSGNPKILENGVVLDSEGDRGDASQKHPRSGIGYGDGGRKVVMMVVDGRSLLSEGCRTSVLGALMAWAGATDAVNVDGGGSSTFYTQALGIRNKPSDGKERSVGNAIFAVHSAPADDQIAALRFVDFKLNVPRYGVYVPHFYGYNRHGVLIDTDVQGVTLSCDPACGTVRNGNAFVATGTGVTTLTAALGSVTVTEPLFIIDETGEMKLRCDSVINDTYHPWTVQVQNTVDGNVMLLDPSAFAWSSSNDAVATVEAATGVVRGIANGEAVITGSGGDFTGSMRVLVERPAARVMAIDPKADALTWKLTIGGGKNGTLTAQGDGFNVHFTGSSTRSPYIKLSKALRLWSLPDTLRMRVASPQLGVKDAKFVLKTPAGKSVNTTVEPVERGGELVFDLPTSAWTDASDMMNFPISLVYLQLDINAPTAGTEYDVQVTGLETVYDAVPALQPGDVDGNGVVNGSDVTALYNALLNGAAAAGSVDVDGNGLVNGSDVTALYNLLLK